VARGFLGRSTEVVSVKFNLNSWLRSRLTAVCLLLTLAVVALSAADGELSVWGNNDPRYTVGVWSYATTSITGTSSYTKTRVTTYSGSPRNCTSGNMDSGWCAGVSGWMVTSSNAGMKVDVTPYGYVSGESMHFADNQHIESNTSTVYVADPPASGGPSDGCDTDPGQEHCSPIIIDLTPQPSDRYRLSSVENGVLFDLDGDGNLERTAWVTNGQNVAFLALDRNSNGIIDDGSELFGNYTLPGVGNGFAALARISEHNGDGVIDARDPLFAQLLLWRDANRNGISEARELVPVYTELEAVGLGYSLNERVDAEGNRYKYTGFARRLRPGVSGLVKRAKNQIVEDDLVRQFPIYDVFLQTDLQ